MISSLYSKFRVLSLDVVLGACFTSFLVSGFLSVTVPLVTYLILALSVWVVYTLDHLLDAKEINEASTYRHQFHKKHFKTICVFWGIFLFTDLVLVLTQLDAYTIKLGLVASCLVFAHLVLVKLFGSRLSVFIQKEFGVAINFAFGVLIPPLGVLGVFSSEVYLIFSQVLILAFVNLIEFSWYEIEVDTKQGQTSIARTLGAQKVKNSISILLVMFVVVWGITWPKVINDTQLFVQMNMLVMFVVFFALRVNQSYFKLQERYRIWGDIIFSSPVFLLLL